MGASFGNVIKNSELTSLLTNIFNNETRGNFIHFSRLRHLRLAHLKSQYYFIVSKIKSLIMIIYYTELIGLPTSQNPKDQSEKVNNAYL